MTQDYDRMLKRYDRLWRRAERILARYVPAGRSEIDLKELNTALTLLKRVQDARRALHQDMLSRKAGHSDEQTEAAERAEAVDAARASRILARLEEDENE